MLLEEVLIIPIRCPCWYGYHYSQVGRADEGGAGDATVLLGNKEDPKVAVLTSSEVVPDQRRIHRQELMDLFN